MGHDLDELVARYLPGARGETENLLDHIKEQRIGSMLLNAAFVLPFAVAIDLGLLPIRAIQHAIEKGRD